MMKKRMKGISLAIDTTIIIILAVVVLAVLIGIFFLVAGPTGDTFKAELTRNSNCNAYRNVDAECNSQKKYEEFKGNSNNENLLKELNKACNTLKKPSCSASDTPAGLQCIKACCIGCGGAEKKCEDLGGICAFSSCDKLQPTPGKPLNGQCPEGRTCCSK